MRDEKARAIIKMVEKYERERQGEGHRERERERERETTKLI
jgi:hypothetical protein